MAEARQGERRSGVWIEEQVVKSTAPRVFFTPPYIILPMKHNKNNFRDWKFFKFNWCCKVWKRRAEMRPCWKKEPRNHEMSFAATFRKSIAPRSQYGVDGPIPHWQKDVNDLDIGRRLSYVAKAIIKKQSGVLDWLSFKKQNCIEYVLNCIFHLFTPFFLQDSLFHYFSLLLFFVFCWRTTIWCRHIDDILFVVVDLLIDPFFNNFKILFFCCWWCGGVWL